MSLLDQLRHKPIDESQQKSTDMRTVYIGIGHQNDLVVTKLGNIKILMDSSTKSSDHCLDLSIGINLIQSCLFYIQYLTTQGQDSLCCTGTCCLRTSSCGVSLNDVNLAVLRILIGTVCQLTGQSHGIQSCLSPGEVSCLSGCLSGTLCQNRLLTDGLCNLRILL